MGANLSTPEKIAKCARSGDAGSLSMLLADLQRNDAAFRASRGRYLEHRDEHGNSPLTLAAARGHLAVCKLLLQYGANLHHVNAKADGGSALHEAVAHRHEAVVELLLAAGGNPFVENAKGFTAMDIACSTRNVPLLRRLEQCAPYAGWLLAKVPQFGGLGSSWQRRWVVVSHRYPNPQAPPSRQLTHCVFLAYKTLANTAPAARVWLDGARAREVFHPKAQSRLQYGVGAGGAPAIAQAAISLHRKHELPSGLYTTGGHSVGSAVGGAPQEGYTFYLRPDDGSQMAVNALDRLVRTVNNRGFPPSADDASGSAGPPPPSGPLGSSVGGLAPGGGAAAPMASAPGNWAPGEAAFVSSPPGADGLRPPMDSTASDELIARRLQEEYDAEAAAAQQQQQGGAQPPAHQPQSAPPSFSAPVAAAAAVASGAAAAAAAASQRPDYLTGGSFYPAVHFPQPGSAPAAAAAAHQQAGPLQGTSSAPSQLFESAAAAGSTPSTPGVPLAQLHSASRPTAPSLLDLEYPPMPSGPAMPLAAGVIGSSVAGGAAPSAPPAPPGAAGAWEGLPASLSGRNMSAPRLEDESWLHDTPAAPPSRPASDPGDASQLAQQAAAAAAAGGSGGGGAADDSATCVVCMDAESTAGVLHGDSVHKCLCRDCAQMLKDSKVKDCPLCRSPIEAFIMRVF